MTNGFKGTPKFTCMSCDHARVTDFYGCVLIRAVDTTANEVVTIAMTPAQARALAQGIIEAADRAEGKK